MQQNKTPFLHRLRSLVPFPGFAMAGPWGGKGSDDEQANGGETPEGKGSGGGPRKPWTQPPRSGSGGG
ncbi:MAG: hypothetical protein IT554_07105, partial [Sphingomonadaceae bacterium]|nr:hypothetical protein [Sphingomonadaceae bacterium]